MYGSIMLALLSSVLFDGFQSLSPKRLVGNGPSPGLHIASSPFLMNGLHSRLRNTAIAGIAGYDALESQQQNQILTFIEPTTKIRVTLVGKNGFLSNQKSLANKFTMISFPFQERCITIQCPLLLPVQLVKIT